MLNIFSLIVFIAGILFLGFGIVAYSKNRRNIPNRNFGLLCLGFAIWNLSWLALLIVEDETVAIFFARLLNLGAIWIPVLYLQWVLSILKVNKTRILLFGYVFSFVLSCISFSTPFISGVQSILFFRYWPQPGPLYIILIIIGYFGLIGYAVLRSVQALGTVRGIRRMQIVYLLIGSLMGLGGGSINFILMYQIEYISSIELVFAGALGVMISPVIFTYAAIKYRFMNIRTVVSKSFLYFFMVALVASFFVFVTFISTDVLGLDRTQNLWATLISSFIVVVFIDPLKKLLSKLTDDIFFKGKVEYDVVLEKISRILAEEIDLEPLLSKMKKGLESEVKIKTVDIWVKMGDNFYSFVDSKSTQGKFETKLLSYLQKQSGVIVTEELKRQLYDLPEGSVRTTLEELATMIDQYHWEMVIPIISKGEITGILGLHHKLSGDIYSGEEINFFGIVSAQLAVAIEKSKLYEEVGRFNEELKGKVERATERLRQTNVDLEARNKFLTTTQNISNLISRSLDINHIIQTIADSIASELGYIGGILSFVGHDGKYLYPAAITRSPVSDKALALLPKPANTYKTTIATKENFGAQCFLSGSSITRAKLSDFISPPVPLEAVDKIQQLLGIQSVVGVPVYTENQIIGVIDFMLAIPEKKITRLDYEMMNNLADQIGIVYRNVKLFQELEGANKELQQANSHLKQLDTAKSEFLSIASHQLRTPISAVKGYLSMLLEGDFGKLQPQQSKIITDVFESSSRLARLINIFLNVSRIESGRFKLSLASTDMNQIVEGVVKELQQQAKIKNLKLIVDLPKKPTVITVDSDKIREVILNLIDNAIKYTQSGSITISQELRAKEYQFQTKDTGMGILAEEVGGLFKKFVRGTGVAQVNTQGSGLGLYIAQRVVAEHGGKIWVESDGVGKGSTFQFTIPVDSNKTIATEQMQKTDTEVAG